jgi:hypothetical protein
MPNSSLYFIDANIPMYAAGLDHPLKSPCAIVLDQIARGRLNAATDTDVIQEILHRYTSLGRRQVGVDVGSLVLRIIPLILPVRRTDIEKAIELHARHTSLQARDSVHAAVMLGNGIAAIISADHHFDSVPGLERSDPSDWSRAI